MFVDGVLGVFRRVGVVAKPALASTPAKLVAALQREEWDVVIYDPATSIPLELVYQHAPSAAVVHMGPDDDMADELERIVATRTDYD
jgi:hypothetical protein